MMFTTFFNKESRPRPWLQEVPCLSEPPTIPLWRSTAPAGPSGSTPIESASPFCRARPCTRARTARQEALTRDTLEAYALRQHALCLLASMAHRKVLRPLDARLHCRQDPHSLAQRLSSDALAPTGCPGEPPASSSDLQHKLLLAMDLLVFQHKQLRAQDILSRRLSQQAEHFRRHLSVSQTRLDAAHNNLNHALNALARLRMTQTA